MLATNIEKEVKAILEKKERNGWLRTDECAKIYGKGNGSRETKFYRWRKLIEKGSDRNFQVIKLPNNITFIGLKSADPKILESLISKDKKNNSSHKSRLGLLEFFDRRAERKLNDAKSRANLELLAKKYPESQFVEGYSRQMIPALRKIAGIVEPKYSVSGEEEYTSPEDMKILVEMTKDALRKDPKLRELFENFEQKNEEVEQMKIVFTDVLMKKLTKELGKTVNAKKATRLQSFVGDKLPSLICNHMLCGSLPDLYVEDKEIWLGGRRVAKEDKDFSKIDEFVKRETADESNITTLEQIKKIKLDALEAQRKLRLEIRKLIIRIKLEN